METIKLNMPARWTYGITAKKCKKSGWVAFFSALVFLTLIVIANSVMAQTKPWVAPAAANAVKNAVPSNPTSLKAGESLYITNCAPCHGKKGKGDGPAAAALSPKPANHTSAAVQSEKDGSLFWKISEGHNPMPPYKTMLSETQRWQLVDYIRSLAK
jgi:mono/diheme cytochrome c family protein